MYLFFQLKTHASFYEDVAKEELDAAIEYATIPPWWAVGLLIVSTVLVAVCAEFLVDSIDGMVEGSGISLTFVGLILLPIVGNAAEVSRPPFMTSDANREILSSVVFDLVLISLCSM